MQFFYIIEKFDIKTFLYGKMNLEIFGIMSGITNLKMIIKQISIKNWIYFK